MFFPLHGLKGVFVGAAVVVAWGQGSKETVNLTLGDEFFILLLNSDAIPINLLPR